MPNYPSLEIHPTDLITLGDLKTQIASDPTYGIYAFNIARVVRNDTTVIVGPSGTEIVEVENAEPYEGTFHLEIGTPSESNLVTLPNTPTPVPVDLTSYGQIEKILSSRHFKSSYDTGQILLVTRDCYNRFLEHPEVQEQRALLMKDTGKVVGNISHLQAKLKGRGMAKAAEGGKLPPKPGARLTPVVYEFIQKTEGQNEAEVMASFKRVVGKLKIFDLETIVKDSALEGIREAASSKLAELKKVAS